MVIAIREDHPVARMKEISVADLRNEAFIVWRGEQAITMHEHLLALVQEGSFPLRVAQSAPSLTTMIALVAGGAGIAYVPESLGNMNVPLVCFRPLVDLERVSEIAVCYRSDENSLAVGKLLKILDAMPCVPKDAYHRQIESQGSGSKKPRGSRSRPTH
jgi:DNA-binding transcriptional LysR family regulator